MSKYLTTSELEKIADKLLTEIFYDVVDERPFDSNSEDDDEFGEILHLDKFRKR